MEDTIHIFDTTLRDGEQSPGCSMNLEEKLKLAHQLEALRVDVMEAGFPIASDGDFESVRQVAREIRSVTVAGLARAMEKDIRRCWEALDIAAKPRIHTFIATSDIHLKFKLKRSRDQVLEDTVKAVRLARSLCDEVEFSAEDAGRSDLDYLCQIVEAAIAEGATIVNIPDTVGYCVPEEFGRIFSVLRERVPNIGQARLSCHCHNDLGLAVANSLAAIRAGARQVECTINGIGERAGNASLEEIVMALRVRREHLGFSTGIQAEEIYKTSHLLSNLTGMMVQANKAVVGKNAFAHEAGIHQDGVLKQALTYEIMTPQSVGVPTSNLVLGKHSGRHALSKRYLDLGYTLDKKELDRAYMLFTKLADKKKNIYDEDLLAIVHDGIRMIPERYHLKYVHATGGNQVLASATVQAEQGQRVLRGHGFGLRSRGGHLQGHRSDHRRARQAVWIIRCVPSAAARTPWAKSSFTCTSKVSTSPARQPVPTWWMPAPAPISTPSTSPSMPGSRRRPGRRPSRSSRCPRHKNP